MTIAIGARLGPYEVVSALGAGDMGEVYRKMAERRARRVAAKALRALVSQVRPAAGWKRSAAGAVHDQG